MFIHNQPNSESATNRSFKFQDPGSSPDLDVLPSAPEQLLPGAGIADLAKPLFGTADPVGHDFVQECIVPLDQALVARGGAVQVPPVGEVLSGAEREGVLVGCALAADLGVCAVGKRGEMRVQPFGDGAVCVSGGLPYRGGVGGGELGARDGCDGSAEG